MIRAAVVILNFNGENFLRQFLPSVLSNTPEGEVIVADNGSTDQSLFVMEKEFPNVRVIKLDKNYGFCGGYNRALAQVKAHYYILLNSDIEVTPNWLTPMLDILDRDKSIAAVQPKILSFHQKNKFEYAGAGGGFIDTLGYPYCRGRIFDHQEEDEGQYDDEVQIFWASGASLVIRSEDYQKFGGLDEDFFAHMEEIDLCWKLQRDHHKVYYCGKSTIYHVGAGTLAYDNPRKIFLNFRNGLSLIYYHFDPSELLYKFPLRVFLDWVAALSFLLKGKPKNFAAVLQAHQEFFQKLGLHRSKRRALRLAYPTYARPTIHPGLIIVDYYLRRKKKIH